MKKICIISFLLLFLFIASCSPVTQSESSPAVEPATEAPSVVPTTAPTAEPSATLEPTPVPSPTALPGSQVYPIDSLGQGIPWLPMEEGKVPGVNFMGFNTQKPPFNNHLVRQAFSYAVDREKITSMVSSYGVKDARPASVLTPPETLGRDVYGEVGITFDPQKAKDLLMEAGYDDTSTFPQVTLLVNLGGSNAIGAHLNIANAMAAMWQEHLGVAITVEIENYWDNYRARLADNPPGIFRMGWGADYNDPDNFLREVLHSDSELNYGRFSNEAFNDLVELAAESNDPFERMNLYLQAERILVEEEAAVIPLYHSTY